MLPVGYHRQEEEPSDDGEDHTSFHRTFSCVINWIPNPVYQVSRSTSVCLSLTAGAKFQKRSLSFGALWRSVSGREISQGQTFHGGGRQPSLSDLERGSSGFPHFRGRQALQCIWPRLCRAGAKSYHAFLGVELGIGREMPELALAGVRSRRLQGSFFSEQHTSPPIRNRQYQPNNWL
jgi:hypothetical protein